MQLVKRKLPRDHRIFLFGDLHEGATHKYKAGVQKMIDAILAHKHNYAVCMGDVVEGITIDDKRYQADTIDPDSSVPLLQYQNAISELMPIKNRIITILDGNHDIKIASRMGNFIKELMCPALNAEYGTYTARIAIQDRNSNPRFKLLCVHGSGSISAGAGDAHAQDHKMKMALKRKLVELGSDCIVEAMGHTHKNLVLEPRKKLYLHDDGEEIHQGYTHSYQDSIYIDPDLRWFINTGSFLKVYSEMGVSGYAERAMYAPVELGYSIVHVENHQVVHCEKVVV